MFGLFQTGFSALTWRHIVMLGIGCLLLYLGIVKDYEPLLLVPIGFGVLLVNLPLGGLMETIVDGKLLESYQVGGQPVGMIARIFEFGLTQGEIIPCLIFLGLGALTDFGPLIANPIALLPGAAAQLGVYMAMFLAYAVGFDLKEAATIGIVGGADGPTTIYLAANLAPHILGTVAVTAYTYMAMVPLIQPPVVRLITTKAERAILMKPQLRAVAKWEKVLFPILGSVIIILLVPKIAPLIGSFMFGNLLRENGRTDRLADTAGSTFMNILVILLGLSVGCFMSEANFLTWDSLKIFVIGCFSFAAATAGGVLVVKFMNLFTKEKMNPLIGAAGVSAVPMSARVVQRMGQQANPRNFLLMHAMGPNVAGVIGTAVAAGVFLGMLK
ncbi:MAG: sodium ion-translocating decarboxylase subunit beta [Chloroflexota bacterium]